MNCPHCGTPVEPGATFCADCGAALPQPAVSPSPVETPPGRSRRPFIVAGVVVIVLVLCCCGLLIGGGGGAVLIAYLQPAPKHTVSPVVPTVPTTRPTVTARPLPTSTTGLQPTVLPTRTRVPSPTPTQPLVAGEMKTYSSSAFGLSIRYPTNWTVKEETYSTSFYSSDSHIWAIVSIVYNFQEDDKSLLDRFLDLLRARNLVKEIISEDSRTFNGLPWLYMVITDPAGNIFDLYGRVHTNGHGYIFMGAADQARYGEQTGLYTQMMESLRFLPGGPAATPIPPATAAPTPAAAGTYRATVTIQTTAGQPFIRGRVLNRNGRAVSGAFIELYNGEKKWLSTVGTGSDGRYELTVSAGVYYLKLKNYRSDWSPLVNVKWGQEATVDWKEQ